ncbi:hypothetical protein PsorP6_017916 [Peronosclerospora sorghi]|uniref:Uncharacterized protein n=1 Tax=Peronosclerospora sorghi TaxID=230839 RepID=A0ACC0WBR4_9STRA|nr:hypothetical protein PsorP6_017916 [Peronosclerospora sorghi]
MTSAKMEAVRLYRAIYRAAGKMPTRDRTNYVRRRLRKEYDEASQETNPERIAFLLRVAETQLETVIVQAEHLRSTFTSPSYHRV